MELTYEQIRELEEYVSYEGSEVSEYVAALTDLYRVIHYGCNNEKLQKLLEKELQHCLNIFKTEFVWKEEVVPQPDKVYKTLEYIG